MNNGRKLQTNGLRERNGRSLGVATLGALQGAVCGTGKPPKKYTEAQGVAHPFCVAAEQIPSSQEGK